MNSGSQPVCFRTGIRAAARASALAITAVVLLASIDGPSPCQRASADFADFDAITSCGPAGVVMLRSESSREGTCIDVARGGDTVVHADGGPAVGLPAAGVMTYRNVTDADYPGDSLLRGTITLEGPVALPDALPATTVTRTCRTSRDWRNVLSVTCDGPDPEAACSGTLSLRPPEEP